MRTATVALKNLLSQSRTFFWAELYDFKFLDNTHQRYCSIDVDVNWQGSTYFSRPVLINRNNWSLSRGIEVDDLELEIIPQPSSQINGLYFLRAARLGALDGVRVTLKRLFFSKFPPYDPITKTDNAVGAITLFTGRISDIEIGLTSIGVTVKSDVELFNIQWPRHLYQPACSWSLYDSGCRISKAAYTANGTVSIEITKSIIESNISAADNYYDLGTIRFISGINAGYARTVKLFNSVGGKIEVIEPFLNTPSSGDSFVIYPGCDRTKSTCQNKFNNLSQFRGYPFIPQPENAL